jgi:hypothetical protein
LSCHGDAEALRAEAIVGVRGGVRAHGGERG